MERVGRPGKGRHSGLMREVTEKAPAVPGRGPGGSSAGRRRARPGVAARLTAGLALAAVAAGAPAWAEEQLANATSTQARLDAAKTPKARPDPAEAPDGELDIAKEVNCLALNIYFEAATEPEAGKYGVAHVTMNRRDDVRWPGTVCDVVYEDRAFSWTITHPNRKPGDNVAWEQAKIVAKRVYFGLDKSREVWRGVTYYHADYVRKGIQAAWRSRLVEYVQVGRHIFYRPSYDNKLNF